MRSSSETILDRLRLHAHVRPAMPVFRFLSDGERQTDLLTFAQLEMRARWVGHRLAALAAVKERVLLALPQDLSFITAFFGCLYVGAVAVPVQVPHPRRSLSLFKAIARDAQPRVLLTTREIRSYLEPMIATEFPNLIWQCMEDIGESSDGHETLSPAGGDLALLQYTSGSTGLPKGVMVSHANLMHNQEAICRAFRFSDESVGGGWLPMYHDMGLIGFVLGPVYFGMPCVLMRAMAFLQNPLRWLHMISDHRVTISGAPNFAYDLCADSIRDKQAPGLDLTSWRIAFNGSEPVRTSTIERFIEAFRPYGLDERAMYSCYGLAEATLFVAGGICRDEAAVRDTEIDDLDTGGARSVATQQRNARVVGCGQPGGNLQVEIVDPATCLRVAQGATGEIWLAGESVACGYFNRRNETEEVFGAYLANNGGGPFLRTGDFGFIDNGALYITGRLKDLVIVRGKNHYPRDIEETAERSSTHLLKNGSVAFAVEHDNEERLVVVSELRRTSLGEDPDRLGGDIQQAIVAEHGLAAHEIVFVKPGTVPRTSSGKPRRLACRTMFARGDLEIVHRYCASVKIRTSKRESSRLVN